MLKRILNFLRGNGLKTESDKNALIKRQYSEAKDEQEQQSDSFEDNVSPVSPGPRRRAKDFLAQYGIGQIRTQDDVNRIFWEMAARRLPISKQFANAVRIVICDSRQMKSFNRKLDFYNKFINDKFEDPDFKNERQKLRDAEKSFRAEIQRLTQAKNREEKEKNNIRQKFQEEESGNRKVAKKFMLQLKTHQGRFLSAYDFTNERDITEFLSWYKLLKRPISKRTINSILRHCMSETDKANLFRRMVEEHNKLYASNAEDDIDESQEE